MLFALLKGEERGMILWTAKILLKAFYLFILLPPLTFQLHLKTSRYAFFICFFAVFYTVFQLVFIR